MTSRPGAANPPEKGFAMEKMCFEGYGELEWLEPEEYWSGAWFPVAKVGGEEESFEIVSNMPRTEYRYAVV